VTKVSIIYKTTNLINRKIYVGKASGKNIDNNYLGSGLLITAAIKKYGEENFIRIIIDKSENRTELNLKERFWIRFFDSTNHDIGYNITEGGDGGPIMLGRKNLGASAAAKKRCGANHPSYGKHPSQETIEKLRAVRKGESNPFFGKKHSSESLEKMRLAKIGKVSKRKGTHVSEASRYKMSEAKKKQWMNRENPMLGKKRPDVAKRWSDYRREKNA